MCCARWAMPRPTIAPEGADFVILNTCHIREKAAEKIYSELGKLREMRDERREAGGDMTIAVAGCVAQAEGEEIMRRAALRSTSWSAPRPIISCPNC